jgi:hypothetical protein
LLERLLPAAGADGAAVGVGAVGGTSLLGIGGAKLAGLLAVGAVATGGGFVVARESDGVDKVAHRPAATQRVAERGASPTFSSARASIATSVAAHRTGTARRATNAPRHLVVRRHPTTSRAEFRPAGAETPAAPRASAARAPTAHAASVAPLPSSVGLARIATPSDTTRGEFAPRP